MTKKSNYEQLNDKQKEFIDKIAINYGYSKEVLALVLLEGIKSEN